ncbi:MAG: hypothetical protein M1833_002705 [Piccolia ochrophora]|nr:MAG: hypothetical protein M1833_002705 [Piccolia ochrophora]
MPIFNSASVDSHQRSRFGLFRRFTWRMAISPVGRLLLIVMILPTFQASRLAGYFPPADKELSSPQSEAGQRSSERLQSPQSGLGSASSKPEPYRPNFHLLLHAVPQSLGLCKALLSAIVLDYPPPTLLNISDQNLKGSFGMVSKLLHEQRKVGQDDFVVIVDGSDAWFQLPPEVMLERFETVLKGNPSQTVVFGAQECGPDQRDDLACIASSSSNTSLGHQETSKNKGKPNALLPLDSSVVMGLASSLSVLFYEAQGRKSQPDGLDSEDRSILHRIFAEQQQRRSSGKKLPLGRLTNTLSHRLTSATHARDTTREHPQKQTATSSRAYRIGLDHDHQLFQTISSSSNDLDTVVYNGSHVPSKFSKLYHWRRNPSLPTELQRLPSPLTVLSRSNSSLPDLSWSDLPLLTNLHTTSIPALVHFRSDTPASTLANLWAKAWFHPYARTLLHDSIHASPREGAYWDSRGGKGGAWTVNGQWKGWRELCGEFGEEVFGDGKGTWGKEVDDGKVWDDWGKMIKDVEVGV